MMKRIFNLVLAVAFGCAVAFASSGKIGKDISWDLTKGVLTLTGTGEMKNLPKELPYVPSMVKEIHIGDGITSIGDNAFRDCKNVTSVVVPSSVVTIGNNAFRGCKNLESVDLSSSLVSIGDNAFSNCEKLAVITIPYGVTTIGRDAFKGCKSLLQVELPITLKKIGKEAFADCTLLAFTRLNQGLEELGENAFGNCNQLADLADLPPYVDKQTASRYGFNPFAVQKYWERKEEIAAKYGNASGAQLASGEQKPAEIKPSDVDTDIPFTGVNNPNTFVVIIANENYGKLANVPFALNDGNTFALYCKRTLGIPEKNILQYNDATYGSMKAAFSDLRLINDVMGGDMKVIVYYAGHGAPDDATLDPYLVPVDAGRINKDVCVPLASIYGDLGSMNIRSATVFLDACFSGATRDGSMVVAARGIARVPKKQGLTGKLVVFSATSEDQTAMPYTEKSHGLFTYYLLKHLQETKGNVSLIDLKDYLSKNVSLNSTIINRKEQTPTVLTSPAASSEWDNWKLND